jgi:hypothetical protein
MEQRRHQLARMLCDLCGKVQNIPSIWETVTPETKIWWTQHQKEDAARMEKLMQLQAKESMKVSALAKLSPMERQILGL